MNKQTILSLVNFGVPKTKIARRVGITRQELYTFLAPTQYPLHRLSEEKLKKIAAFEGRSLSAVRNEFLSRQKAA